MKLSKIDVLAATFRNAIFDSTTMNIFNAEDRIYEQFDAQVLETCYRKIDVMPQENIDTYSVAISLGFSVEYDRDSEDFFVII